MLKTLTWDWLWVRRNYQGHVCSEKACIDKVTHALTRTCPVFFCLFPPLFVYLFFSQCWYNLWHVDPAGCNWPDIQWGGLGGDYNDCVNSYSATNGTNYRHHGWSSQHLQRKSSAIGSTDDKVGDRSHSLQCIFVTPKYLMQPNVFKLFMTPYHDNLIYPQALLKTAILRLEQQAFSGYKCDLQSLDWELDGIHFNPSLLILIKPPQGSFSLLHFPPWHHSPPVHWFPRAYLWYLCKYHLTLHKSKQ